LSTFFSIFCEQFIASRVAFFGDASGVCCIARAQGAREKPGAHRARWRIVDNLRAAMQPTSDASQPRTGGLRRLRSSTKPVTIVVIDREGE
jgi:hypothetical protein